MPVAAAASRIRSMLYAFARQPEPLSVSAAYQQFTRYLTKEHPQAQRYVTFDGLHVYFATEPLGAEVSIVVRVTGERRGTVTVSLSGIVHSDEHDLLDADALICNALDFARYCQRRMQSWGWM